MRLVGGRQLLGEAALQAQRRELRGELDDDHRISEAAEQLRPVEAAGDEQEGQARGEPEQEAEEVGPPALGERGDVLVRRRAAASAQCAAPQFGPVPISTPSGTLKRDRRLGGALPSPGGSPRAARVDLALGHFEDQLVMDLHQHPRRRPAPRASSAGPIRAIARLMMSALVPWIGALIAARSAPWRSCWILDLIRGKWVLRPNRVVVKPVSRASVSVSPI